MTGRPAAAFPIDASVVRALLAEERPDLADRPISPLAEGWDNAMFTVGDDLIARLPRRDVTVPLLRHELRWLPVLAPGLPLPVPVPVHEGRPTARHPWPWALVPHLPGAVAASADLDPDRVVVTLAGFLTALHRPAPAEAPHNPHRGIPLALRRPPLPDDRRARLAGHLDLDLLDQAWRDGCDAPAHSGPAVWVHGDLHPRNLLAREGDLCAVLDWGDLCQGDPASDLASAWMLLPPSHHDDLRRAIACDAATWTRARAWAALYAALLKDAALSDNDPVWDGVVEQILEGLSFPGSPRAPRR